MSIKCTKKSKTIKTMPHQPPPPIQEVRVEVHIRDIKVGDTIYHNGALRTVCAADIKEGFMGRTIFGDSYRSGHKKVEKSVFLSAKK